MARRPSSTYGGADLFSAGGPALAPPPPRDRRQSLQPPLLTTNFVAASTLSAGPLSTPFSAASIQTPFTQAMAAWGNPSPAGSRGQSPMASRVSYNVQYNPSHWMPGQRQASTTREDIGAQAEDEANPPPPYQPRNDGYNSVRSSSSGRVWTGTERSRTHTPIDTDNMVSSRIAGSLPPTPLSTSPETYQSGLSALTRPSPIISSEHVLRPPAGRRAQSEGFASSSLSLQDMTTGFQSPSTQMTETHSTPLPGPPAGPPPMASRSQSLTRYAESRAIPPPPPGVPSVMTRTQVRIPLPESTLEPIPPTPIEPTEHFSFQVGPSRSSPALHIDTINLNSRETRSRTEVSTSGLGRTGARRGSNRLWERRNQSSSRYASISHDAPSAMEKATTADRLSGSSSLSIQIDDPAAQDHIVASRDFPSKALPTPPLSQKNPESAISMAPSTSFSDVECSGLDEGSMYSLRQYKDLLVKEKGAANDVERLQLFSNFILSEALSRRQRYTDAFGGDRFDPTVVRNLLFEQTMESNHRLSDNTNNGIIIVEDTDPALPDSGPRIGSSRWNDYNPVLSPIASMSHDEMSSRGRAPSRWWESQSGSRDDGEPRKSWRSKRESKYMGVSGVELRENGGTPVNVEQDVVHEDVYGNEKAFPDRFGFFEEDRATPVPASYSKKVIKAPASPRLLDISRFITLPPPYPRHHPAVNNSHPDLTLYRDLVRSLADLSDVRSTNSQHERNVAFLKSASRSRITEDRKTFHMNIQAEIDSGKVTYAEAARAQDALTAEERHQEKLCLQAEFDDLQDIVINPLHTLLNSRISQLDSSINELKARLHSEVATQNFDRPQQEGDKTPEILEFLTQTKWLFELRETIHKELFDLLSQRNSKYGEIVVLPYRQANNTSKVESTKAFFTHDLHARRVVYAQDALNRHEMLLELITTTAAQAVEMQSCAFWDIAPNLLGLLQRIPMDLCNLEGIKIPEEEYDETPGYQDHPYQYLYSLLTHAEKSTYQFIEGQVNLQCLLHEVKTGMLVARYRASQAIAERDGISDDGGEEAKKVKAETALTAELKQKVEMIETQWQEALGGQLSKTKGRVRKYLVRTGGWDSMEAEEG